MVAYERRRRATYESMARGDLIEELCRPDAEPDARASAEASALAATVVKLKDRLVSVTTTCSETAKLFERAP